MNWISNFVKPKIKSLVQAMPDVPSETWYKCPLTGDMIFHHELENNAWVFPSGYHARLPMEERFSMLFDGEYSRLDFSEVRRDPLEFKDIKRYRDRLKEKQGKDGKRDALQVGFGLVGGFKVVLGVFDFSFMGGSMGTAVGESFIEASDLAIKERAAFVVVTSSGGARMQEGVLSLMQLARTTIGVRQVKESGLPYIVILANPTTGGVTASFAMLGDIHIAESGATIGFAGKRVIQQTVGEELPEGFQTSEYLRDHGMVDIVVDRHDLKSTLSGVLSYLHPSAASVLLSGGGSNVSKILVAEQKLTAANDSSVLPKAAE